MWKAGAVVACTVGLSGCLTSNVLVTVRPDGSGLVEYTTTMRPAAFVEFEKLLPRDSAGSASRPAPALPDPTKWGIQDRIGRGVQLARVKQLKSADSTGWALTFEFDDVSALNVDAIPLMPGMDGFYHVAVKDGSNSTRLRMSLDTIPDGMERLTVRFPQFAMDTGAEAPAAWASGTDDEMAALRRVMQGSRVTLAVKTEASLIRTNSPFHEDNQVTLFDADVAQALFSRQISMLTTTPASFDELRAMFADLPGVTLAREREVTLDFQNPSLRPSTSGLAMGELPPDTEVFLASLSDDKGKLIVGPPINISRNPGYDNQPSFTHNGQSVLFASARQRISAPARDRATAAQGSAQAPPQTDIVRWDIETRSLIGITNTPEAEYSPSEMPDAQQISVVRVESDGTQRLWGLRGTGSTMQPSLLLPDIKPVGYHAWLDAATVALFVLGDDDRPSTLQVVDIRTGKASVVASDIGRSLQRMPSGGVSFVQRDPPAAGTPRSSMIMRVVREAASGAMATTPLIRPVAGVTEPYVAWMSDGSVLMAGDSIVYQWRSGQTGWREVADLGAFGLRDISRLAVSPDGRRLALVARAKRGTSIAQ